jgi:hypothetical protein
MNGAPSQDLSAEERAQRATAAEQSKAQSLAAHAARSAMRRAQFAEDARVADRFRDIMFAQFSPDAAKLKQLAAEHRRLIEARTQLSPAPSQLRGDRLSPPTAAAAVTRGPPYDETYVTHGQGAETADKNTGAYELRVQSIGNGHQTVGAGIGFWFASGSGNPAQRFTAVPNLRTTGGTRRPGTSRTMTRAYGFRFGAWPKTAGSRRAPIRLRRGAMAWAGRKPIRTVKAEPPTWSPSSMHGPTAPISAGFSRRRTHTPIAAYSATPSHRST